MSYKESCETCINSFSTTSKTFKCQIQKMVKFELFRVKTKKGGITYKKISHASNKGSHSTTGVYHQKGVVHK